MTRTKKKITVAITSTARSRACRSISNKVRNRQETVRRLLEEQQIIQHNVTSSTENSLREDLFRDELRDWVNEFRIPMRAVNGLLSILNSVHGKILPKDYRTLLNTDTNIEIVALAGGNDWYNGLGKCLKNIFVTLDRDFSLRLNFNIDGLPLYKSSNQVFYPILASIHGNSSSNRSKFQIMLLQLNVYIIILNKIVGMPEIKPMVIAIWCGEGKPTDLIGFLDPFVNELNDLLRDGILINDHKISIFVRCFICDTPARAFIKGFRISLLFSSFVRLRTELILTILFLHQKGIVHFNHRFGCQKCSLPGTYHLLFKRMSFSRIPQPGDLRTNSEFRNGSQPMHNKQFSSLEHLPIDMILDFVTSDSLHLIDHGVIKR